MTPKSSQSDWDLYMDTEPDEVVASPSSKTTPRPRLVARQLQPTLPDTEPKPTENTSKAYLRLKLEKLLLSLRTRKALAAQGVQTLRQLCRLSPNRLASIPGLGTHSLAEIKETLDYYGLSLAPEPTGRSSGKKRRETGQLCFPGMGPSEILRVCRGCGLALPMEPASERFCSPACRQAARLRKKPQAAPLSFSLPEQLVFFPLTSG